jgi:branched-chain amino acid transport system permease protein
METFVSITILGLVVGSQYALYAAGLGLVMGTVRVLNLAHGLVFVAGTYGIYYLTKEITVGPVLLIPVVLLVGGACGIVAMLAINLFGLRPAARSRHTDDVNLALVTVAFTTIGVSAIQLTAGSEPLSIQVESKKLFSLFGASVSLAELATVLLAAASMLGLYIVMNRSGVGRRLRALADSESNASLVGINGPRYVLYAMMTAGALAGIAGALAGAVNGLASPTIGNDLLVKGAAIIVVGGVGSISGSVIVAFVLGIAETYVAYQFGGVYASCVALVLMIVVLRWRPHGIFGRSELQRM